jgi:hypothetical protein
MFRKKNILLAILLIIVAAAIYMYKEFNRTNTNIASESSAYTVTADELIKEFIHNDSLANNKYAGKIILVKGVVKDMSKDERGYYTVSLGNAAVMSSIRCSIDSIYSGTALSVKPGMNVNIKGNCTGYNKDELLGLDVLLNRCLVTSHN